MRDLKSIRIAGWKSIKDSGSIDLRRLNVFIGANGCGKSNLVSFFKLLNEIIGGRFQEFIATSGSAESVLYYGPKVTPILEAALAFETDNGTSEYLMKLVHAAGDTLIFTDESVRFHRLGLPPPSGWTALDSGHRETALDKKA